ncbi:phenoloxidase-activating factor 2-like isoform X2 [Anopheles funestus]
MQSSNVQDREISFTMMHCWGYLLVICSGMIISCVANDNAGDFQACPGGYCVLEDLCPDGMYNESYAQSKDIIGIRLGKVCPEKEVCCTNQINVQTKKCPGGCCVLKHLCPNANTKLFSTRMQIDIKDIDSCGNYLQVCCEGLATDCTTNELYSEETITPLQSSECGQFNPNGLFYELLHNDSLAQYAEYPWMVYIMTKQNRQSDSNFVCGGTLIHTRFVVTTAHNTDGKSDLVARFGEWDISTTHEPFPQQEISVKDIIKHPAYVHNPIQNDIALLLLVEHVQYQQHIRPICLPQPDDQFVGERCISIGWGVQRGAYANVMKKITLPVIEHRSCNRMLRLAGLGPYYNLREVFMCAGGEAGIDMCKGDGGSPLACQTDSGTFVLAGIVSWGIGCGGHNLPGVYVAVNRYVNWINEKLSKYPEDTEIIV